MRKVPFLRLTLFFILGIFVHEYLQVQLKVISYGTGIMALLTVGLYLMSLRYKKFILAFGSSCLGLFIFLGVYASEVQEIEHDKSYYSHFFDEDDVFEGKIIHKKIGKYTRYEVALSSIIKLPELQKICVHGKVQLTSKLNTFQDQDIVQFTGKLKKFEDVGNPYSFDFKKYSENNGVYYQAFTDDITYKSSEKNFVDDWKDLINSSISNLAISDNSKGVLFAMILGEKDMLGEVEEIFRRTGTSHVLAISGLHVGIITAILFFILSFIPERFQLIKYALVVMGVWFFCLISGLAASTVRASIMVTCFLIGKSLKLQGFGYNFCFLAAFFMLFRQPKLIYDIGFQFSFLAILGILYFYEPLYKTFSFKGLVDKIWQMVVMSLSAQLTITPLSLYYFHQFPILFALTSVIAIPATFVIVALGIASIFLVQCGIEITFLSSFLDLFIQMFIHLLNLFAAEDSMILRNLWPSKMEILLYYISLVSISSFFYQNKRYGLHVFLLSFIGILAIQFVENDHLLQSEMIIYADKKHIVIDVLNAGSSLTIHEEGLTDKSIQWKVGGQHIKSHCTKEEFFPISNDRNHQIDIHGVTILIVNKWTKSIEDKTSHYILLNTKVPKEFQVKSSTTVIDFSSNGLQDSSCQEILQNKQINIEISKHLKT